MGGVRRTADTHFSYFYLTTVCIGKKRQFEAIKTTLDNIADQHKTAIRERVLVFNSTDNRITVTNVFFALCSSDMKYK